jgi:primosomal protein N'
VLELARWIAEYYCCPVETALKSVLPDAVRREDDGWRERLFVRALTPPGEPPALSKRQTEVWNVIEEWRPCRGKAATLPDSSCPMKANRRRADNDRFSRNRRSGCQLESPIWS